MFEGYSRHISGSKWRNMIVSTPLEGIRILSMAEQYPGPYATMILADLGADVILIERPEGGDPSRRFSGHFEALNRNKKSVAVDLKNPSRTGCRSSAHCDCRRFHGGVPAGRRRAARPRPERVAGRVPRADLRFDFGIRPDGPSQPTSWPRSHDPGAQQGCFRRQRTTRRPACQHYLWPTWLLGCSQR